MIRNLLHLLLHLGMLRLLQFVSERMLLHGQAQFSLPGGDISIHVFVRKVTLHTQEGVQRLEEQDMAT